MNYKAGRYTRRQLHPDRGWGSMNSWPKWWDVEFHTRPKRRDQNRLLGRVTRTEVDPDDLVWPLGNHKPHVYYW